MAARLTSKAPRKRSAALNGSGGIITNVAFNSTGTLTVTGGGTYAGVIQDSSVFDKVALTVGGSTPLILTGANTCTGATTINSGATLQLGNGTSSNGSISSSSIVTDNWKLVFSNPNSETYGGAITGTGSLTKTGAGTLTLTGANTYSGETTISGGTLIVPSGGSLTSQGGIAIGSSGVAGQNGILTVDGTGMVGQSSGGFMTVGSPGGASTGTLNIGTTTNGATLTANGMTIYSNSTVNIGSGTVTGTLNSNNELTVDGGVLQTANSGSALNLNNLGALGIQVFGGGRVSFNGSFVMGGGFSSITLYSIFGVGSKLETLGGGNLGLLSGASLSVGGGGLLTVAGSLNLGQTTNGAIVVDGAGSKLTVAGATAIAPFGSTSSVTLQNASTGNTFGDINIAGNPAQGGTTTGSMSVLSGATATIGNLNLDIGGGDLSSGETATFVVDGTSSSVTITSGANVNISQNSLNPGTLTVSNNGAFTVGAGGTTTINAGGTININGGIADLKTLIRTDNSAVINFTAGSLSFLGSLNVGVDGLMGQSLTLDASKVLTLNGTTTIDAFKTLTLSGGTLSTGSLVVNGTFAFDSGTLDITGSGGLTIGSGSPLGSGLRTRQRTHAQRD